MNVTLGVALITALSTLSAGALASYTGLRINRRQANLQRDVTIRQLRRDAYVGLMNYCDELAAVLTECWGSKPPKERQSSLPGPFDKARLLFNSMETPLNTVYLEGPESIMGAVAELKNAY
jgi:hypothetical protein